MFPPPRGEGGAGVFLKIAQKCYISVNFGRNGCKNNEIEVGFPQFQKGVDLGEGVEGVIFKICPKMQY